MGADIESCCKRVFGDDEYVAECNWFVWKVAERFCRRHSHAFGATKDAASADDMIGIMESGRGWRRIAGADAGEIVDDAIEKATEGHLVVAGMTSAQLRDGHGHLAIVVAGAGEFSSKAQRVLPFGYAGSRNPAARIPSGAKKHLGWTFPSARWKEIGYWYRRRRLSTRR